MDSRYNNSTKYIITKCNREYEINIFQTCPKVILLNIRFIKPIRYFKGTFINILIFNF